MGDQIMDKIIFDLSVFGYYLTLGYLESVKARALGTMGTNTLKEGETPMKVIAIILAFSLAGCAVTSGEFKGQGTTAGVGLTKNNYKVVKVGAKGESGGFSFLGFIPFSSPQYSQAKERLYKSVNIPMEGKAIALVNQTEDNSYSYFLLFAIRELVLTADVIEYIDEATGQPSPASGVSQ